MKSFVQSGAAIKPLLHNALVSFLILLIGSAVALTVDQVWLAGDSLHSFQQRNCRSAIDCNPWTVLLGLEMLMGTTAIGLVVLHRSRFKAGQPLQPTRSSGFSQPFQPVLQQIEAKFAAVFQSSPDPMSIVSAATGKYVEVNQSFLEATGYSLKEVQGKSAAELNLIVEPAQGETIANRLAASGSVKEIEFDFRTKSGEHRTALLAVELIELDGQPHILAISKDITARKRNDIDRKRVEETLRQNEWRWQRLNSFVPAVIYTLVRPPDGSYFFEHISAACEEVHEISQEALLANASLMQQQIHPDDLPAYGAAAEASYRSLEPFSHEMRFVMPSGKIKWMRASSQPEQRSDGSVAWHGVALDITEQKQTELKLQQQETFLRSLYEGVEQAIFVVDVLENGEFRYVSSNVAYQRLTGISLAQLEGKMPQEIGISEWETLVQNYRTCIDRRRSISYEEATTINGQLCHWYTTLTPLFDEFDRAYRIIGTSILINALKQTELKLRQALQYIDLHFENSPLAIIEWDIECRVIRWSKQAERIFGWTAAEAKNRSMHDWKLVYEEDIDRLEQLAEPLFQGKLSSFSIQNRNYTKDGQIITCQWYNSAVVDEAGNLVSALSFVQDISDRQRIEAEGQQAQQALRESKARLQRIADVVPSMIYTVVYYPNGIKRYEYISSACRDILELEPQALLDDIQLDFDHSHPDDLADLLQAIEVSEQQLTPINHTWRWITPDGNCKWLECRAQPEKRSDGAIEWYGVVLDVTDRERVIAQLRQSEAAMTAVLQAVPDLIVRFNREGTQLAYYSGGSVPAIKPIEQTVPCSVYDVLPAPIAARRVELIQRAIETGEMQVHEYVLSINGSDRYTEARIVRNSSEDVFVFIRDITERMRVEAERKRAEADLQRAKEAAEAANRSKSLFLANMSHELRTPLNAILGFAQLLQRDAQLTSQQREHLAIINRNGEHLLSLINDVLSIAKIEANQLSLNLNRLNLSLFLDRLAETFAPSIDRKGLTFQIERSSNLPQWIKTDEAKLRQVLNNLLDNAIKFTQFGQVTLRVAPVAQTDLLQFTVSDTGCGIASAELPALFEAFMQTQSGRQSGQGSGLGLFICRRLVQLLGGDIRVESQPDQGTRFQFEILAPAEPTSAIDLMPAQSVLSLASGQPRYRILVVDDVSTNRLFLVHLLTEVGFDVVQAATGAEAIALWQQHRPHLVWLDLRLPELSGYEVAQQIRAIERNSFSNSGKTVFSPVVDRTILIAISASVFDEDRQRLLAFGFNDAIGKPCSEQLIFDMIAKYLPIKYRYATPAADTALTDAACREDVQTALSAMPLTWRQQLYAAAIAGDDDNALHLVEQMPDSQSVVRTLLTRLIGEFQLEKIILWLESLSA